MPELKPTIKKNTLSPNIRVTAYQLMPEEHADGRWHGPGVDDGEEGDLTELEKDVGAT